MENLNIEETKFTPSIVFDIQKSLLEIKGDSLPENTTEFYKPLMASLFEYFQTPHENITVNLELTYFNSSSSKLLFDFFDLFLENNNKTDIVINWFYDEENENMEEAGEDFKDDFEDLEFNLIVK